MSSDHGKKSSDKVLSDKSKKGVERREFLKGAAAVAGAAMLGPSIIACSDDDAGPTYGGETNGTLRPMRRDGSSPLDYIEHVVILQMENRSFDHYFASLAIEEGRTDILAMSADASNDMRDGTTIKTFRMGEEAYLIDPDPPHMWGQCHDQWKNGTNEGFVSEYEKVMDADLETLMKRTERQHIRAKWGLRPQDPGYDEKYAEEYPVDFDTRYDEQYAKRLGWVMGYHGREDLPALYTLADHFTLCDQWYCSVLGPTWPNRNYSLAATSMGVKSNGTTLSARTPYYSMVNDHGYSVGLYAYRPSFYFGLTVLDFLNEPTDSKRPGLGLRAEPLQEFFEDCEQGTLSNVSIVEPDYALNDDHPPQDIRLGESFIASVYEALRKSPQWDRTLLVIYYDEHGGFYDHVIPPTVENDDFASEGFDQLGFRVPGLLVGPLVKPGYVMKNPVDHASVPGLISRIFDVDHVNKRSETAGTFEDAFDIERIDAKNREAPPVIGNIEIPHAKVRQALNKPYGQPELYHYCRKIHGQDLPSMDEQLQEAEDYFRQLDRMRVARVI